MSRFGRGWVSISRKIYWPDKQQNDFYGDGHLMAIWSLIIAWANVFEGKSRLKGQQVLLKRGQLVTSENDLVRVTGFTRSVVRRRLKYLETSQRIEQQKSQAGNLITILKYDEYQQSEDLPKQPEEQQGDQPRANHEPTTSQPSTNDETHNRQINNSTRKQGNKETRAPATTESPPPGSEVWNAYAHAYEARYRSKPKRNAKVNSLCKQLVIRLGKEDAIKVVEFYLTHNKSYYLQKVHALDPCVADCEGLHTQMVHNHRVTTGNARQEEVRQTNAQTFQAVADRVAAKLAAKKEGEHDGR